MITAPVCALCSEAPPIEESKYCGPCKDAMRETFRAALHVLADEINAQKAAAAQEAA